MIPSTLEDGYGTKNKARINGNGELHVVEHPHPPKHDTEDVFPFRQFFTDDGTPDGDNDMIVSGSSAAPLDFYIEAIPEYDIYVKYISAIIGDQGSPSLTKFGALSALANGIQWLWSTQSEDEYELHNGIKTNLDFIRIGGDTAAIGTGSDAFLADVTGGSTEKSYMPNIDISETFGMPWGLKLKRGSKDKIIFRINDNLAGLDTFNIIAYGIRV